MADNTKTKKEEMVTILIPKTKELKKDVRVWVNGKSYQIQRGKSVKVPASVAEVIRHSERMEEIAMEYSEANGAKED